ncbi:hypothetical protein ACQKLN_01325 [Paenibacillus glucanolyticus]
MKGPILILGRYLYLQGPSQGFTNQLRASFSLWQVFTDYVGYE